MYLSDSVLNLPVFCLAALGGVWAIWLLNVSNVCTLTHQSELVQGLLGSTSQLGDMPGPQSTQAVMPTKQGASTQSDIDVGIGRIF